MANAIDPVIISCYHAHIYYDDASRDIAARKLRLDVLRGLKIS